MHLETYISDLLYRYDCVTVPDLGAFITNRISAKIHDTTHTFYPPKKVLSFNERLQKNDGLLVHYISEIEKIPYTTALLKVSKQVKSIRSYLSNGETIAFKNIGELTLNVDGNILFKPSEKINYLTDSFGLSHFSSDKIERHIYKKQVEAIESEIPVTLSPEKRSSNWLRYAAAAIIIVGITGMGAAKLYFNSVENHNQIAQEEANAILDQKVQEATFVISNPLPAATLSLEKQTGNFHVVAGAFRIEANSEKKVKQLRRLGYKARKIGKNRYGLHEVVYSSYPTRSEATKALYEIRRKHNRDAWLLIKTLD
jgi:hypothetical protein